MSYKLFELISSSILMLNSEVISITTKIEKLDERSRRMYSNVQLLLKAADPIKTIRDKKKQFVKVNDNKGLQKNI
jgi:hypothetical protein